MHITTSKTLSTICWPLIKFCEFYGKNWPVSLVKMRYFARFGKFPNLKNPQDLNEKILWLKLYSDTSKWTELADKYKVRKYVEDLGFAKYLVNLYGAWSSEEDIDFDSLPSSLIFKANNGDGKGSYKIIHNLQNENKGELKKLFHKWLTTKNIGNLSAEPQYKGIPPMIIAEELLPFPKGNKSVCDYKIWCINGCPKYIWVCNNRDQKGGGAAVMTYDTEWNPHPEYSIFNSNYREGALIPKPQNLNLMLKIASKLSHEFPILRVDLYNIEGRIYFGELTFTSLGGMMNFYTPEFLDMMGSEADISNIKKKKHH